MLEKMKAPDLDGIVNNWLGRLEATGNNEAIRIKGWPH